MLTIRSQSYPNVFHRYNSVVNYLLRGGRGGNKNNNNIINEYTEKSKNSLSHNVNTTMLEERRTYTTSPPLRHEYISKSFP